MTKRIAKFITSESIKNTEAETRTTPKPLTEKTQRVLAALRDKVESTESTDPDGTVWGTVYLDNASSDLAKEGIEGKQFAGHLSALKKVGLYRECTDPEYAKLFGYVVLGKSAYTAPEVLETNPETIADLTAALETPAAETSAIEPETTAPVTEPIPASEPSALTAASSPAKTKKAAKKAAAKPKADLATLFTTFKASKMANPFKETIRDFKRFVAASGAGKLEDIETGTGKAFRDEKDVRGFIGWLLRGTPGYKK
jgi:hypothetical protein